MRLVLFTFLALLLCASGYGEPQRSEYEAILFPVSVGGLRGAEGSVWRTRISVFNDSDDEIRFFGAACYVTCAPQPNEGVIPPGAIDDQAAVLPVFAPPFAWLWHVKTTDLAALSFSSLITEDHARNTGISYGTQVPVVRESEMEQSRILLAQLPYSADYRVAVRIYTPQPCADGVVKVSFLQKRLRPSVPVVSTEFLVQLSNPWNGQPCDFPEVPGFAQLSSDTLAPPDWSGDILVEAMTPGLKFWALAAVTSNKSQAVTIISPQRLE